MSDRLTFSLHYGRAGRRQSWYAPDQLWIACAVLVLLGLALPIATRAQYPGQITKKDKDAPALRAVAVLEWTGDLSKPKTCRLVPVTVFDGEQLQDGGEYLARPEPLAVAGGVEYVLQQNGAHIGLFDIQSAGQQQGSWVGFGNWKPVPSMKPKLPDFAQKIDDDQNSDRPVLHRKKGSVGGSAGGSDSDSAPQGPPPDPDRPTLHKKPADEDTANAGAGSAPAQNPGSSAPAPDTSKTGAGTADSSSSASDPNRPQLKRGKAKQQADEGYVESLPGATDPDRPRLLRGKSTGGVTADATPTLVGLPAGMEQAVAVSDPRNRPEHPWNFAWANPSDEQKMKADLEDAARKALGLEPAQTAQAPKPKTTARTKAKPVPPPEPAALLDEEFRVFELAYGSGATLVLSAHTDGPLKQQKFVTLIAQPDLYGSLLVLFKSVTDGDHLDDRPRMRLIDAVDVLADNRGELLFELRGSTQRQFALYRVLRGTAKELFVTGGGASSLEVSN
jgi:hypothetical protein